MNATTVGIRRTAKFAGSAYAILIACTTICYAESQGYLRTGEEIFNFGFVPQHAQVAHAFWLHNTGTESATITSVKTNCGCTQAPMADTVIAPGDSAWVEVILGTGRMIGEIEKHTRVVADTRRRVPVFTIQALVVTDTSQPPPVTVEPTEALFDSAAAPFPEDGVIAVPVVFRNPMGEMVEARAIDIPRDFVHLSEGRFEVPAGGSHEVVLEISPQVMDQPFAKSVTFEMSDPARTRLTVPFGKRPPY